MLKAGTYMKLFSSGMLGTIEGGRHAPNPNCAPGIMEYIFRPDRRLSSIPEFYVSEDSGEICPRPSDEDVRRMLSQENKAPWLNQSR